MLLGGSLGGFFALPSAGGGGSAVPWLNHSPISYWADDDDSASYTTDGEVLSLSNLAAGGPAITGVTGQAPLYKAGDAQFNGKNYLDFDGANDYLAFASSALPLGNNDFTVGMAFYREGTGKPLFGNGTLNGNINNCFTVQAGFDAASSAYGPLDEVRSIPGYPSTFQDELIWLIRYEASSRTLDFQAYGSHPATDSVVLTNAITTVSGEVYRLGDVDGISEFWNGRLYGFATLGKRLSDAEKTACVNHWLTMFGL